MLQDKLLGNDSSVRAKDLDEEIAIAKRQFEMFMRAYSGRHEDYLKLKEKCNDYYCGDQWDERILAKLQAEGKPALTINLILSTINTVLGEQIGRRMDINFKPRRDTNHQNAWALNKLVEAILDANRITWLESDVFQDGLIEERGWYEVWVDFSESLEGEIKIESRDGGDIVPDPNADSYDPRTWNEVYDIRWLTADEVRDRFGEEAYDKVQQIGTEDGSNLGRESVRRQRNRFSDKDEDTVDEWNRGLDDKDAKFSTQFRVITREFYKPTDIYCLVNVETGELRELPVGTKKNEAEAIAQRHNVPVYKKNVRRVYTRTTVDQYVLHDDWSIYKSFRYIPYFPYFRRGRPFGMVRNLLSPQEQLNKLSSQELHIVNSTANSGYIVETGTLANMTTDELRTRGAESGLVIEVNNGRLGGLQKIQPNAVPHGIDRISGKSENHIRNISGINDAMLGMEGGEVSGVVLDKREARGQVQVALPIDNLGRTRHLLAEKMLELIKDFYTEERIFSLVDEAEPEQPVQEVAINQMQPDGTIINDVTRGSYSMVISSRPARDNFADSQFASVLNLRNVGVNIPSYRVIQYSDLADKERLALEMKQLEGLGEKSPEMQELEQRMATAQMALAEAQAAETEAKVGELQTRSELNSAKAQLARLEPQMRERELEYKDVADQRGSGLRQELAALSAISKLDAIDFQSRVTQRDHPDGNKKRSSE